jgi:hypothetical protein
MVRVHKVRDRPLELSHEAGWLKGMSTSFLQETLPKRNLRAEETDFSLRTSYAAHRGTSFIVT